MKPPRFEAHKLFSWLAVALILIIAASTVIPFSSPAGRRPRASWSSRGTPASPRAGWIRRSTTAPPRRTTSSRRIHDALIKNQGTQLYDHAALAERFTVAADSKSATFVLRKGTKFHNGDPVTPQDVKFSYENYRGAKADVFKQKTERVEIVDDRTVRFVFKEPFLDFAILFGTANVAGPGWVVPEKYYKQVGPDGFKQKPIGAGPSSSCATSRA